MGMFNVKLPNFKKMFGTMSQIMQKASAATLTNMAFEWREQAIKAIEKKYTIRNPAFLKRSLRVGARAKASDGPAMFTEAGSIATDSFSGWTEPIIGEDENDDHRLVTLFARGGNPQAIVKKKARLTPGKIPNSDDITGLPEDSRIQAAIALAFKAQGNGGRVILSGGGFPRGLFVIDGTEKTPDGEKRPKVKLAQAFRKPKPTKHWDWHKEAVENISPDFIQKKFNENVNFFLKKELER